MATMADIAQRAGVSLSTVSYALSGKRAISEPTRRRVLQAIDDLDYHPHAHGRALASKRSRTIALFFPHRAKGLSEMHLEFITHAAEAAGEHGYAFLLSTSPDEDAEILRMSGQGLVDGLILMEITLDDPRAERLRDRGFPFAMIGHRRDNAGISYVDLDFADAVETAVRHLVDAGHHAVALVNAAPSLLAAGYGPAVRALEGYTRTAADVGLDPIAVACEPTPRAGERALAELRAARPDLSGVVTINREAIGGMVQAAADLGLAIPDRLSLVAVVTERLAQLFSPTLTTIDFPAAEMGRLGAEMLIRRLEGGEDPPTQRLLRAALTVRQSSGPYRGP